MNFLNIPISDALSIWDNVKDSFKEKIIKRGSSTPSNIDFSYITPTLLALGKFSDNRVDELLFTLQGQPSLLWNLSGKPFSAVLHNKLKCQVLENPWVTPGHFTQAPSLECVFAQCYAIKSWLDLRQDHISILHCSNGRSRTGILMACFLKARLDCPPSLSPSYRILFENVDAAVNNAGYPNPAPLHLRCLSLTGLPVDDIPCVEIWDMTGLIYTSHCGMVATEMCSWSADYGDGFYRVGVDICGDFSVMCRFGGSHTLTRDKTTLIFKYQHNTGFLPPTVIELSKQNVDLNPEYAESIEVDVFHVHLMFSESDANNAKAASSLMSRGLLRGRDAFEAGLDEISKQHLVVPDASKCSLLVELGYPHQYSGVALQISNNSVDAAKDIIKLIAARSRDLQNQQTPITTPIKHFNPGSLGVALSGEKAQKNMQLVLGDKGVALLLAQDNTSSSSSKIHTPRRSNLKSYSLEDALSTLPSPPVHTGVSSGEVRVMSLADIKAAATSSSSPSPTPSNSAIPNLCVTCKDDTYSKRDQILTCSSCSLPYHTHCVGLKKIPFSLKDSRERLNREKYIARIYGSWVCAACKEKQVEAASRRVDQSTGGARSPPRLSAGSLQRSVSRASAGAEDDSGPTRTPTRRSPAPSSAAAVMTSAGADSNGSNKWQPPFTPTGGVGYVSVDQTNTSGNDSGGATSGNSAVSGSKSTLSGIFATVSDPDGGVAPSAPQPSQHDAVAIFMGLLSSVGVTVDQFATMTEEQQRDVIFDATAKRAGSSPRSSISGARRTSGTVSGTGSSALAARLQSMNQPASSSTVSDNITNHGISDDNAAEATSSNRDNPAFAKYFGMMKAGLPLDAVSHRMRNDGVLPNKDLAEMILQAPNASYDPTTHKIVPIDIPMSTPTSQETAAGVVTRSDAASALNTALAGAFASRGLNQSKEDNSQYVPAVPPLNITPLNEEEKTTQTDLDQTKDVAAEAKEEEKTSAEDSDMVAAKDHPVYNKYFRMVTAGVPKQAVKNKLTQEGLDPDMIDKDPNTMIPRELKKPEETPAAPEEKVEMVALQDHPIYGKYVKMLKVGLPMGAVKNKMTKEGHDCAMLDKAFTDLVPLNPPAAGNTAMVAIEDHPIYSKYIKMLKVGLPLGAVKNKMTKEGYDASILDRPASDLVPLDPAGETVPPAAMKALKKSPRLRKKKLHWHALDKSKVGRNSLWAASDSDDEFQLDTEEFNKLFVESKDAAKPAKATTAPKKKVQNLIDMKRAQNASIALARIKVPFSEVREKVELMEDGAFTTDQLKSLEEYLPTPEESSALSAYKGPTDSISLGERYMMEMLPLKQAAQRIQCMIFKQQFKGRVIDIRENIRKIENACDDVKMSLKLKKVLKTILKVGNQMNDGEEHVGFTVDSLLKLQSAKAFDKKTSILQYVVMLIYRNDEQCLSFPEELSHVSDASRNGIDFIISEKTTLRGAYEQSCQLVTKLTAEGFNSSGSRSSGGMAAFLLQAGRACNDLDDAVENLRSKYASVLQYFGEDPSMPSQEFFSTLNRFVQFFEEANAQVAAQRKIDERKQREEAAKQAAEAIAKQTSAAGELSPSNSRGPVKFSRRKSSYL